MEVADDFAGIEVLRTREARNQADKRLRRLAYTDDVTGLPNRAVGGGLSPLRLPIGKADASVGKLFRHNRQPKSDTVSWACCAWL